MKNNLHNRMLFTALTVLQCQTTAILESLEKENADEFSGDGPESNDIGIFDEALEAVLESRCAYCQKLEIPIEDGVIRWNTSDAQLKQREAEAGDGE